MKKSERALKFKKDYLEHFEKGGTVKELTDKIGLSQRHAYNIIHEIENEKGLPKGTLLPKPHAEHIVLDRKELKKTEPINFSAFQEEFRTAVSSMDKTLGLMEETLDTWPEIPNLEKGEER